MRGNKFLSMLGLMALGTLAGCATAPKVSAVDANLYIVSAAGSRLDSQASTNTRALKVAAAYCDSQDKALLFRQSQEHGTHFSAKREDLTFTCISASDPGYLNAGLRRDAERSTDPLVAKQ